jgi:hypothetical protein
VTLARTIRHLTLVLALTLPAGCASAPPPGRVYIVERPPVFRREVVPVAPGPRYVWVPGRWVRAPRGWAWTEGRYILPPTRYRAWVPGEWHHGRRGWYYVDGHWR